MEKRWWEEVVVKKGAGEGEEVVKNGAGGHIPDHLYWLSLVIDWQFPLTIFTNAPCGS